MTISFCLLHALYSSLHFVEVLWKFCYEILLTNIAWCLGIVKPCERTRLHCNTHWLPFSHVPRMKPSIFVNSFFRLLLIIQVSLEHIRPVKAHLARDIRKEQIRTTELNVEKWLKIVLEEYSSYGIQGCSHLPFSILGIILHLWNIDEFYFVAWQRRTHVTYDNKEGKQKIILGDMSSQPVAIWFPKIDKSRDTYRNLMLLWRHRES